MKKILSIMLVLIMSFGVASTVFAGGEEITDGFFEMGFTAYADKSFDKGYAKYDAETQTLILNGVNAQSLYFSNISGVFNIILADNSVNTFTYGMTFDGNNAEYHISGNGVLNMDIMEGGAGCNISSDLIIDGGTIGGSNASIFLNGGRFIINGGKVDVNGTLTGVANDSSPAFIFTGGELTLSGDKGVCGFYTMKPCSWLEKYTVTDENGNALAWATDEEYTQPVKADGTPANFVRFAPVDTFTKSGEKVSGWAQADLNKAIDANLLPEALKSTIATPINLTEDISRGKFAAVAVALYQAMGGEVPEATSVPFFDVYEHPNDNYPYICQDAVIKACNLGLMNGVSETEFAPASMLTREQASTILCRIYTKLGGQISASTASFSDDSDISGWAKDAVYFMADKDILKGTGDNNFSPKANTQAQQAIIIALRMLENL